MLIQDVGATWGGGGAFTSGTNAKMNLKEWSGKNVWKKVGSATSSNPPDCQASLTKSFTAKDGLDDPMISEEGRRFAAGLMCQLTDAQIQELFTSARVSMSTDYRNHDGTFKSGFDEQKVVAAWVAEFKKKREDVAAGRCKWKNKPADLSVVDNPAGLATVPNNCSAKLF